MEDLDVGTVAQLGRYLLLGPNLVADQTNDGVLLVVRVLLEELELGCIR